MDQSSKEIHESSYKSKLLQNNIQNLERVSCWMIRRNSREVVYQTKLQFGLVVNCHCECQCHIIANYVNSKNVQRFVLPWYGNTALVLQCTTDHGYTLMK